MHKSPVAFALALLVASAAWAKTDPVTWMKHILVEMDAIQKKDGYAPEGETRAGALATGGEARLEFALAGGAAYRFVVVCESACGAGEVELLDRAGARIAGPGVLVEMPKLEAAPAAAGTYILHVAMTDCAAASCAWSARVYAKR
ncbi:MAG: hypothetical protein QOJ27_2697 [Sphingomonadales bacterium]|nr:hypothetical protein [Sphingomonadales bacterium]